MADCNKTIDFLREYARMHGKQKAKKDKKKMYCEDCPLADLRARCYSNCIQAMMKFPKDAIHIVQKWSDEDNVPPFCPPNIGYEEDHSCDKDCVKCWNRPYMEENEI